MAPRRKNKLFYETDSPSIKGKNEIKNKKGSFKSLPELSFKNKMKRVLIIFAIAFLPFSILSGFIIETTTKYFSSNDYVYSETQKTTTFFDILYRGVFTSGGFLLTLILTSILVILVYVLIIMKQSGSRYELDEDKNVKISNTGEYGTSKFMNREDLEENFNIDKNVNKFNGQILGKTEDGEIVFLNPDKLYGNKNILIIGSAGSGKSRGFAKPAILKIAERGENIIVTDPKGELFSDSYIYLKNEGYDVRVLNLKEIEQSDGWSLASEILRGGDIEKNVMIQNVATTIVDNSVSKKDAFASAAQSLLTAFLYLVIFAEKVPEEYDLIDKNGNLNFKLLARKGRQLRPIRVFGGNDISTLEETELNLLEEHFPRSISSVYDMSSVFGKNLIDSIFTGLPNEHPAKKIYMSFTNTSENLKGNVFNNLSTMLQLFSNAEISNVFGGVIDALVDDSILDEKERLKAEIGKDVNLEILESDSEDIKNLKLLIQEKENQLIDIRVKYNDLEKKKIEKIANIDILSLAKRKTAIFVSMSDQDGTFAFLASIFFNTLFTVLVKYIDSKMENSVATTPVINVIMDEFANIGKIPYFERKMSTLRQRKIIITIILQTIGQLYNLYPNYVYDSILGNCAMIIFLGTNDDTTAKFIAERAGTYTGIIESESAAKNTLAVYDFQPNYKLSQGKGKVQLITPHDAINKEYKWTYIFDDHPNYEKFINYNMSNYIPWRKKSKEELVKLVYDIDKKEKMNQLREESLSKHNYIENLTDEKLNYLRKNEFKENVDIDSINLDDEDNLYLIKSLYEREKQEYINLLKRLDRENNTLSTNFNSPLGKILDKNVFEAKSKKAIDTNNESVSENNSFDESEDDVFIYEDTSIATQSERKLAEFENNSDDDNIDSWGTDTIENEFIEQEDIALEDDTNFDKDFYDDGEREEDFENFELNF